LSDLGTTPAEIVQRFFREQAFADLADYLDALREVEGTRAVDDFDQSLHEATMAASGPTTPPEKARHRVWSRVLLLAMPEGDFLTALELGAQIPANPFAISSLPITIGRICQRRGVAYTVTGVGRHMKFEWVGDPAVHEQAIGPVLGVLDDRRLAGGPRAEFLQARKELREGSAEARKQAVAEACNAVESTMKVVLDQRGVALPATQNAQNLYNALLGAGLVKKEAEELVLAANRFGNRRGRHGAGPVQHDVARAEAESVVASAAVAIVLLASELP
jgi:hypothetical protein